LLIVLQLFHQVVLGAFQLPHLSQEVLLAGGAGSSVLLDLLLQETDLFFVEVALACKLFDPSLVLPSLFDLGVEDLLELADLRLVL